MQPMLTVDFVFRTSAEKTPCPINSIVKLVGNKVKDALVLPRLQKLLEESENQLTTNDYLAGSNLTAADITAIYPFTSYFMRYPEMSKTYPKSKSWLERMYTRPAFQRALSKVDEKLIIAE